MSSDSSKIKRKRNRIPLSCTICRKRKVKCDKLRPHCQQCTKTGVAHLCHYMEQTWAEEAEKELLKDNELKKLRERVKSLEKTLSKVHSSPSSNSTAPPTDVSLGDELHLDGEDVAMAHADALDDFDLDMLGDGDSPGPGFTPHDSAPYGALDTADFEFEQMFTDALGIDEYGGEARKTKKKIKGIQQATAGVSQDTSENPNKTIVPAALPQLTPTLVSLLEVIEPEVLYAGYDSSVPDSAWRIMTTLNMLGGRQVIAAVKWAKAIPGFRNLHLDDQMTLLQYSWMFLMAFALGWRSYRQSSGNLLCFAPDLIINEQRMSLPCMYDQCKHMLFVSSELQRLQVSYEEYLCMKTLLLLSSVPKEGLKSQELFDEIRMTYIKELGKAIVKREGNSSQNWQRFYQLTKLLDSMHEVVENLLTYCFQTFLDKTMSIEFPEMLAEIITNQIPKYSNGNIKKLLFHQK